MVRLAGLVLLALGVGAAQSDPGQVPVATQLREMMSRSGHSPTTDEIQAAEMMPGVGDADAASAAVPLLNKALADPDSAKRKYALAMLVGMQSAADAGGATDGSRATQEQGAKLQAGTVNTSAPAAYKAEVAKALVPVIPSIAKQLTDEDAENRTLAATVLGGFSVAPPASVFPPLLSYLKRDDATGPVGAEVVSALLQLGPVSDDTASAIAKYLKRPDQTSSLRGDLVDAIASRPNQSILLNKALLTYLDADDSSLRSRVILSLPQLALTPEMFDDLKNRVQTLTGSAQDPLPVVNAARSVANCWTSIRMVSGCPVY